MENDLILAIGELKGRVTSLEVAAVARENANAVRWEKLDTKLDSIADRLDSIDHKSASHEGMVKGGWWVVSLVAGSLLAFGGLASSFIGHLFKGN